MCVFNQYFQTNTKMDFSSERVLVLTKDSESITAITNNNNEETTEETVTLSDFFSTFLNSNNFTTKLDKLSVLDLPHCQITDLPVTLGTLPLKRLDLSYNKFAKVPACIHSGLRHLEFLGLGHNSIQTFEMPPGCLHSIKNVKLNHNLLTSLPKWIITFQCTNLEELNFSFNKASNYNYNKNSYNMHIMKLKKLKLINSQLIDIDFDFLKCHKYLEYLDISNESEKYINRLYEADNLFVKQKWKQLKVLKMNNLSLSLFPEGIMWIESLTELYLKQNYISWFPKGIEYMVNLQILDISENTLVAISDEIAKLELLEVLLAAGNSIEICPDFSKMSSLKTLDLYDNLLEHVSLNCDTLNSFDLEQNYFDALGFPNYESKKCKLRDSLSQPQDRVSCQKIKPQIESDYEDEEKSFYDKAFYDKSYYDKLFYDKAEVSTNILVVDDTEDWDTPTKICERNPEIDSADEAWDGEECKYVNTKPTVRKKVYVEDEDWMFEDVEEIVL